MLKVDYSTKDSTYRRQTIEFQKINKNGFVYKRKWFGIKENGIRFLGVE